MFEWSLRITQQIRMSCYLCDFLFLLSIVTWKQVIIETFSSLKYAGSSDNQHNY